MQCTWLFMNYQTLKQGYRNKLLLWSDDFFVSSIGHTPPETSYTVFEHTF